MVAGVKAVLAAEHEIIDTDGVRVVFADGWGLVRASNTQPVLVLRFEAEGPQRLAEIQSLVETRLSEVLAEYGAP